MTRCARSGTGPRAAAHSAASCRMCLLTAQRSRKVAAMKWGDVKDGVWTVPCGPREKGTGGKLTLPPLALAIIEAQPRYASNQYIFAGRGERPYRAWTRGKAALDAKLPPGMPQWQMHDLRRTARSLMSRAGVPSEHAERVLGHAIARRRGDLRSASVHRRKGRRAGAPRAAD